jgi:hypothetical protein
VTASSWWYRVARIDSWARDKITTRGGKPRTHRPEGDAAAKKAHALHALAARPRGWDVNGCAEVSIYYCRTGGHARDVDRVLSLVPDALRGIAWSDDNDTRILSVACRRLWMSPQDVSTGDEWVQVRDGETLVVVRRVDGPPKAKRRAA